MGCNYFLRGSKKAYTYKELIDLLQNKPYITSVDDIVYSKSDSEILQDSIYQRLSELRKEGFIKDNMSYADGEPVISDNDSISTQELIDTPIFISRGKVKGYLTMSDQDYINDIVTTLTSVQGGSKSKEEAEYIARQEVEHWKIIGEDSANLHTLISDFDFRKSKFDFQQLLNGTKFEKVAGALYDSLIAFRKNALGSIKARSRGAASQIVYNLNLKTELEDLDKTLFGHIDMVVIDGDGDLHLFNYKVTTTSIQPSSVKLEKYKYQMALLKQILASHGFKVRNATLNIVPIKVGYNEDYSEINGAIANKNPMELTVNNGRYVFTKYDTVAKHFIRSTIRANQVTSQDLDEASKQLQLIFPERDIASNGIRMTAQEWIKKNRAAILDSNNPEYAYEIEFGEGDTVYIKSHTKPENNQEILEEIQKRQELLDTNSDVPINRLLKAVRGAFKTGGYSFLNDRAYSKTGAYLNTILHKYFPTSKETPSDWEFVENDILNGAGIMLFRNKTTNHMDVVVFSPYNLETFIQFKKGSKSVIGCHFATETALGNSGVGDLVNYKSTYGNIEAVRAMVILNQILPKLSGDFILGKLQVISLQGNGQGIPFNLETLNKECFSNVLKVINKLPKTSIRNNFTNCQFLDRFSTLLQDYDSVIKDVKASESEKQELVETGFGALATSNTIEARLTALRQIESAMREAYPGLQAKGIKQAIKNVDKRIGLLYQRVVDAITYYSVGDISPIERKISSMNKNAFISSRVPNRNVQLITNLYTETIRTIAEQADSKWIPIRNLLYKFYEDIGYSRLQNSVIGNQAQQFNDLYRKDANGNRLLRLLNPYDTYDMSQISTHRGIKQQFLKKILFEFAKIRYPMNGIKFNFTSESDPALQSFIEQHRDTYFNIPLEKASASTRRQTYSIRQKLSYARDRAMLLLKNPKQAIEELNDIFNKDERDLLTQSIEAKQLQNKFSIGEGSGRQNYIAEHGIDYFETNLETLLTDFIERDIETKEYNKALVIIKGVLFQLDLLGENPNQKGVVEQTKQIIEDFVNVNIFRESIMDETSQKIMGITAPLRNLVSNTLIAGNVISALRDTFEGVWQNTLRSLNHYQTDIDKTSLAKAYATVVKNSFTDGRSINIVNQLCQIYCLSNIDVSRISEGLRSERGVMNFKNWMYATLRRPDFLNRMTLFVAKCYKDGVYDAFDIKDGKLVYDWKKDERFKIYASGNKADPKYTEQMGAYYNAVRAYNLDHPEATILFNEDLPMPYSFQEVEAIKNVANSIYGSYDRSTRAAYEHMALGTFFGMFSTWMNGIYANYAMKPGQYYNGEFKLEQARDAASNLLFFDDLGQTIVQITDDEGNVKYFYEGTGQEATENLTKIQPVMDKVPIVIQGIWYTITDTLKAITSKEGSFKEDIWLDPVQRKNLDKLFSDFLAWLIFSQLYMWALSPAYKEFKKGMKERDVMTNAVVELLYKSSSRSYDGFRGVYNVWEYLGENTNPPIYTQNIKLLKEAGSVLFGSRTFSDALNGNIAIFKTFQDTQRAYNKSQKK